MSDSIFSPLEDKPKGEAECVEELNAAWACLMIDPSECPCFEVASFSDSFPKEIRKQFYSAQAWLPATDAYFCEVANQRVCQHYDIMQSCCCTESTAIYRECYINKVLVWELPIPKPCEASCDDETLAAVVTTPSTTEYTAENVTEKDSNAAITVLAVVLSLLVLIIGIGAGAYFFSRKKVLRENQKQVGSERPSGDNEGIDRARQSSERETSISTVGSNMRRREAFGDEEVGIPTQAVEEDDASSTDHSTIKTVDVSTFCRSSYEDASLNIPAVDMTPSVYKQSKQQGQKKGMQLPSMASGVSESIHIVGTTNETEGTNSSKGMNGDKNKTKLLRTKERLKKERNETKASLAKLDRAIQHCERRIQESKSEEEQLDHDSCSARTRQEIKKDINEHKERILTLEENIQHYLGRFKETEEELRLFQRENPNLINENSWSSFPSYNLSPSPSEKRRRQNKRHSSDKYRRHANPSSSPIVSPMKSTTISKKKNGSKRMTKLPEDN